MGLKAVWMVIGLVPMSPNTTPGAPPKLQCKTGRSGLGSSRPRLRTPASAGHPAQSSLGRDSSCCSDDDVTKSSDINANLRLIVSPKGFTGPALNQAKDAGVGVFSLLPEDPAEAGFTIGVLWYARSYQWDQIQMQLRFHGRPPEPGSYTGVEVLYLNKPVVKLVLERAFEDLRQRYKRWAFRFEREIRRSCTAYDTGSTL